MRVSPQSNVISDDVLRGKNQTLARHSYIFSHATCPSHRSSPPPIGICCGWFLQIVLLTGTQAMVSTVYDHRIWFQMGKFSWLILIGPGGVEKSITQLVLVSISRVILRLLHFEKLIGFSPKTLPVSPSPLEDCFISILEALHKTK